MDMSVFRNDWDFFLMSLQVTKVGFTDMSMKLNCNHACVIAHHLLGQRKLINLSATWDAYWSVSSLLIGLSIRISYLLVRRLMENTICPSPPLRLLWECNRRKNPEREDLVLHHDCALAYTSYIVHLFFVKNKRVVIPHQQYLYELSLCNFVLLSNMKKKLNGLRFDTIDEIQMES